MEQLLVTKVSLLNIPAFGTEKTVKLISGGNILTQRFLAADMFALIFPWNSLKIVFFVDGQDCGQAEIKQVKGETEAFIEVNWQENTEKICVKVSGKEIKDLTLKNRRTQELGKNIDDYLLCIAKGPDWGAGCELGIDLDLLDWKEQGDFEYCKSVIIGLNEKAKVVDAVFVLIEECEKSLEKFSEEKKGLIKSIQEQQAENLKLQSETQEELRQVHEQKNQLKILLNSSDEKIRSFENEITELQGKNKALKSEKKGLSAKIRDFEQQEKLIKTLQEEIKTLETERDQLRLDFKKTIKDYEDLTKAKDQEYLSLTQENKSLEDKALSQESEIFKLTSELSGLSGQVLSLSSEIDSLKSEIFCLADQEAKASSFESLSKKHQSECVKTQENMQKTTSKFSEIVKSSNQEKIKTLKTISELNLNIAKREEELKQSQEKYLSELSKCLELKSKIASLQETISQSVDSQHISKSLLKLYSDHSKSRHQLILESSFFFKNFINSAEEMLTINRYLEQIREIIEKKDEEILIFKDIIIELQRSIPYCPVKDDEIDLAMAEYINDLAEPLDIPFIREDEGIYFFGTKKVLVKMDNGRLSVRIGGGALLLAEYIEMYTNSELAKLEDRRRKKNTSRNKMMGKVIEKIIGERVKNNDISPLKAAKIIKEATGKNRALTMKRSNSRVERELSRSPSKIMRTVTGAFN